MSLLDGLGDVVANWFPLGVERRTGNGISTSFWHDQWVGVHFFILGFIGYFKCLISNLGV